jgi:electron transfer flavoprotein alpha subunit
MKRLLLVMQTGSSLASAANHAAIAFAQEYSHLTGAAYDLLFACPPEAQSAAENYKNFGAYHIMLHAVAGIDHPLSQDVAKICAGMINGDEGISLVSGTTQWGTDVLAQVAGLLDLPMLGPILAIDDKDSPQAFRVMVRTTVQTVRIDSETVVLSIDRLAFGTPKTVRKESPVVVAASARSMEGNETWVESLPSQNAPIDLISARVVVAGGRVLGDAQTFGRLIGGLAEKLGGVPAATGAAVQAGIAPKELLVGQTGQTVSPDLYIAAGISGSDQHTGGMRNSRVVVAINSNPNATIFRMADYGLVADVHQALPELTEKL